MKLFKLIWTYLLFCSLLLNVGSFVLSQDKSSNEKYQRKMWKKWLKKNPPSKNALKLELDFSFPSEELEDKNIFLWNAHKITDDFSGNIYVLDSRLCQIFKFDSSGNLLQKFGHKGRGPGEFANPLNIMVKDNFIIVYDSRNSQVQFFNGKGEYIKSFKIYDPYLNMVMSNDGLIFAAPIVYLNRAHLIDILTKEGELVSSFGEVREFKDDWGLRNHVELTLNEIGELFVAFRYSPLIRKYSVKRELLYEISINKNKIVMLKKEINSKIDSLRSKGKKVGYTSIITAVTTNSDNLYVLLDGPRIEILEFDNKGNQNSIFWIAKQSYKCGVSDFLVQNRYNEKEFYLLMYYPESSKVDVYSQRH
ncbi:MAG: 6-bladed beta-propeller [Methanosarcinales archaeon]